MHLRMEVRARSEPISSSSVIIASSRYFEFETTDGERKPLGGRGTGGDGKPYRKQQWEWIDVGDGTRVAAAAAAVRKRAQKGGRRKKTPAAEGRRTSKAAANGEGKRKLEAEEEEGGRPSAGGPHRCGARRGQSAAA